MEVLYESLGSYYSSYPIAGSSVLGYNLETLRFLSLKYFKMYFDLNTNYLTLATVYVSCIS